MPAPKNSQEFDHAYRKLTTPWVSDLLPEEIQDQLNNLPKPGKILELGCGLGIFTYQLAEQGWNITGVDFSSVAIAKAKKRRMDATLLFPLFLIGDVTHLFQLTETYSFSYDVGCFHCLQPELQRCYRKEIARLLAPGSHHLLWAMDDQPNGLGMNDALIDALD